MILGVVSDIHCNSAALQFALDEMEGTVDEVLIAGDAVLQYRFSNEVLELAQTSGARYIAGNHELTLLQHGKRATSAPEVRQSNLDYMASAPKRIDVKTSGRDLVMVHASPFAPYSDYLFQGSPQLAKCAELEADILILGHTHVAMAVRVGDTLVVNPGSLGQSDDPNHPGMLSYGILDTDSEEFTVRRFPKQSCLAREDSVPSL